MRARVVLVEGSDRLLGGFPEQAATAAREQLESLGVEVRLGAKVTAVDETGVTIGDERLDSFCVAWAAGVRASELGDATGAETDRSGRVRVLPDLSIPGHPSAFVAGDLACAEDSKTGGEVPAMAPGAMQMGRHIARVIRQELRSGAPALPEERAAFRFVNKGMLATIGRSKAVAAIGKWQFRGFIAWVLWALVHVMFLIEFRNRAAVMFEWTFQYFFYDRGARIITHRRGLHLERPRTPELHD